MLHLVLLICGSCEIDVVPSISGASLLACPSSFPASSGTYSDCSISGTTKRAFNLSSGTLTLRSCTFTNCTYSGGMGGCICSTAGTSMDIYSCSFTKCTCSSAGGCIWSYGAMYIYSSSFTECKAGDIYIGGAIACCGTSSTLTLEDSVFDRCFASSGTVFFRSTGESVTRNCRFTSCTADGWGGGIGVDDGSIVTVTDCTFVSGTSSYGGAIEVGDGTANINYCFIDSCTAAAHGGGIHIDYWNDVSSVVVLESEIRKCSAVSSGGGIACLTGSANLTVSYLTITDCTAASSYGQAIHISNCKSFKWDHLCITGSGTLVKSETSSISVPSAQELSECPRPTRTPTQSRSPSRSQSQSRSSTYCFTDSQQDRSSHDLFIFSSMLYVCLTQW